MAREIWNLASAVEYVDVAVFEIVIKTHNTGATGCAALQMSRMRSRSPTSYRCDAADSRRLRERILKPYAPVTKRT